MRSLPLIDPTKAFGPRPTFTGTRFSGAVRLAMPVLGAVALSIAGAGCVSVKAPEKPIVIELNVNIRQEVVYRLAEDAGNTIESNPDIF
jgi:hypothetical protein